MVHWVRSKNLPFSVEEVKKITLQCPVCAETKPRFSTKVNHLIKATAPFERLSVDFKGPIPSVTSNRYILTIVDEYSRFPFAFPCADLSATTVIRNLDSLFSIFGMPAYIHSDRGSSFMSTELKQYLYSRNIATSRTTAYNPQGNGQVERFNGIIWKTCILAMKTKNLSTDRWELVLQEVLHAVRSLLCTATNATPHERMFAHSRRTSNGESMPTWLASPGPVLLKKYVRSSKYDPLVEEVELIEANPDYCHVRMQDGRETTVSSRHLAPRGKLELIPFENNHEQPHDEQPHSSTLPTLPETRCPETPPNTQLSNQSLSFPQTMGTSQEKIVLSSPSLPSPVISEETSRHSERYRRMPRYLEDYQCM